MRESLYLIRGCIQEAKGADVTNGYATDHLDAAENLLREIEGVSDYLLSACRCALGHLTGNMDGDMDLGDPVEMLRAAISKATA